MCPIPAWGVFRVAAFDGVLASTNDVMVSVIPLPELVVLGWGENRQGELDNGSLAYIPVPLPNSKRIRATGGPELQSYPTAALGLEHIKALTTCFDMGAAVTEAGNLLMWGVDSGGYLFGEGFSKLPDGAFTYDYDANYEPALFGVGKMNAAYGSYTFYTEAVKIQMTNDAGVLETLSDVVDVALDGGNVFVIRQNGTNRTLWTWGFFDYGSWGGICPPRTQTRGVRRMYATPGKPGR